MESKSKSAAAGTAKIVGAARRQFLIAPRRHVLAQRAGVLPLTATELHSKVTQLPGVEVIHISKGHKHSHRFSMRLDEAVFQYVVKLDAVHADALRATAGGHIIVEEDHVLCYGRTPETGDTPSLRLQSAFDAPITSEFLIRVQNKNGKGVSDAVVTLVGDGPAAVGTTDADGNVRLQVAQLKESPVRTLFVRPAHGYWNKYLQSLSLSTGSPNLIELTPLDEPDPNVAPSAAYGWGQRLMGLQFAAHGTAGAGIKVAVVDSGADSSHPFLRHIVLGLDLTSGADADSWRYDSIGHGSHCAGVIGAKFSSDGPPEASGAMRGFVPEAELHVLKVFPGGQFSSLNQALDYCIEHDIDVVNLSLGSPQPSETVEQKLIEAASAGVAVIVAAGNSGGAVQYPARSDCVLAVSALGLKHVLPLDAWEQSLAVPSTITPDGLFAPQFSCFGPQIAVCAPGVGIVSTVPDNSYAADSGTSMAAPHIAGLAALLLSDPKLTHYLGPRSPQRVSALFQLIRMMCTPVSAEDPENRFGAGLPRLQNLCRIMGQ